jgi:hypothetical protein
MDTLSRYLAVAAAGALGAMARYFLGGVVFSRVRTSFPLATFVSLLSRRATMVKELKLTPGLD